MHSRSWSRCVAAATSIVFASAVQANSYTIVDLGKRIAPVQINNKGSIAGQDASGEGEAAVIYRGGSWHRLAPARVYGFSLAIDGRGDVVGMASGPTAVTLWPRAGGSIAVAVPDGSVVAEGYGVSDSLTVVGGWIRASDSQTRCFRTTSDNVTMDLGMPHHGDFCQPSGINGKGWIALTASREPAGAWTAFVWKDGVFHDLGGLSAAAPSSAAAAIDAYGHVVGCSSVDGGSAHAFWWNGKTMFDIGASDLYPGYTCASALSGKGAIVGTGQDVNNVLHAVRFEGGAVITLSDEVADLGSWTLDHAVGIDDDGDIVGTGTLGGKRHGFMLVPQVER